MSSLLLINSVLLWERRLEIEDEKRKNDDNKSPSTYPMLFVRCWYGLAPLIVSKRKTKPAGQAIKYCFTQEGCHQSGAR